MAGATVVAAYNHLPLVVRSHARNHPGALHVCQDIALTPPIEAPEHDALLASPACQGHSPARGKEQPRHDASRATAWAVVDFLQVRRTPLFSVENVVHFLDWELYPVWRSALEVMGYALRVQVLCPTQFGLAEERPRLFITGKLGKVPPPPVKLLSGLPAAAVRSVLEFTAPMSLIRKPGRAPATLRRVARGRGDFGSDFVMPYYGSGSGLTGRSLDRPIATITTLDRWALVMGNRMRMLRVSELKRIRGFPADYHLEGTRRDQIFQLGNAVSPPVGCGVVRSLQEAS